MSTPPDFPPADGPSPHQGPQPSASHGQFVPHEQPPAPFPRGSGPQSVERMPGTVRAARITALVLAGACLAGTVLGGVLGGPRLAGAAFAGGVLNLVVGILAVRYDSARKGIRIASIVLASMQILVGLGAMARTPGNGLLPLAGAITLVALLSQSSAKAWFTGRSAPDRLPGVM